jgi:dTDP-glucose 4,6-dehydratase
VNILHFLLTGGAGFIGSHLTRELLREQKQLDQITVVDRLTYATGYSWDNLSDIDDSRLHLIQADIVSLKPDKLPRVDVVINAAAASHVDRTNSGSEEVAKTNLMGTAHMLEWAREQKTLLFLEISTDEVYGSADREEIFSEQSGLNPSSPYSASKAGADLLTLSYGKTHDLPVMITRSTNNYGSYQYPEKLIPRMIMRALNDQNLPLYAGGHQERDWLNVRDHVSAINLLIELFFTGEITSGEIFNIAQERLISNRAVAEMILAEVSKHGQSSSQIVEVGDRPAHDLRYRIEAAKIRKLGWQPRSDFQSGLAETVSWYLDNQDWAGPRWQEAEQFYQKRSG